MSSESGGSLTPQPPFAAIAVCPVCGEDCAVERRANGAKRKIKRELRVVPPSPHYLGPWLPDTAV